MTGGLSEAEVRAVNLIEILAEEAEEEGRQVPAPPEKARQWSDEAIRAYFASGGNPPPLDDAANGGAATATQPPKPRLPPADDDAFKQWFPGLTLSRTASEQPAMRLVCFANAGNAEDMYTNEGTGVRRSPSPLLEWCRAHSVECLAPQYPGRAMRLKEAPITAARDMAAALLPVVASKLYDTPWVLIAHSVGTWVGFEFLQACRAAGVPPPCAAFVSAMPAPTIPFAERPWRQQRTLGEEDFKDECRGWDIQEVVFSPAMWPLYHPLLRADFTMFDEYEFTHQGAAAFEFPVMAFWGTSDRRVKEHHVRAWGQLCGGPFKCEAVGGNHLWPLDKAAKGDWLRRVVAEMDRLGF